MARFLTTAVVLSSGLGGACLDNAGPDPGKQIFQASLAQWNEEGPDSYVMVLRRQTLGANPDLRVVITVENDVVVSRFYEGTDIPVSVDAAAGFPDVPGLFSIVLDAMEGDPFLLSTEYDPTYGYPSSVTLDVTAGSTSDNVIYTVVEFTPASSTD